VIVACVTCDVTDHALSALAMRTGVSAHVHGHVRRLRALESRQGSACLCHIAACVYIAIPTRVLLFVICTHARTMSTLLFCLFVQVFPDLAVDTALSGTKQYS
jgi:hypothetical protein